MGSAANKYAREVAAFLSCPVDGKKLTQMVECLRRKSVSDLLAADSFFFVTLNGTARLQTAPSSSVRFPMEDLFSMFPANNGTMGKSQAIDSSKIVQQQNPGHWSEESSSSSSSSVTSDLHLDSYPLGNGNVVSNSQGNKSKGVSSESRNSSNNYTTHNSYMTAASIIGLGVLFLLVNILLLLREFYKRDKSRRGALRKTQQHPKTQHHAPFSGDSIPASNQVRCKPSHYMSAYVQIVIHHPAIPIDSFDSNVCAVSLILILGKLSDENLIALPKVCTTCPCRVMHLLISFLHSFTSFNHIICISVVSCWMNRWMISAQNRTR